MGKSGPARRSGPRPLARRLELTTITPGAISAAGIIVRNPLYSNSYPWLIISLQARFLLSPDTVFAEEGNKTLIKYREDFNRYKAFLVKYSETDAIKGLVNKLNANILQVYSNDAQEPLSFTIPHAGEEDLVAQALLTMQGTVSRIADERPLTIQL